MKRTVILCPLTSQVHEIHPSHAFLDVFDGRAPGSRSNSDPDPDLMAYHSSLEGLGPQCEWRIFIYLFFDCEGASDWLITSTFPQHFYIKGSSVHSMYHGSYSWPPP